MNGEPSLRDLYDAILHVEKRFHEFDEDLQSFRIEVNRRLERLQAAIDLR
jgi:hypothetical protein